MPKCIPADACLELTVADLTASMEVVVALLEAIAVKLDAIDDRFLEDDSPTRESST